MAGCGAEGACGAWSGEIAHAEERHGHHDSPGAPDGEYVVFQFNTSLEQKSAAVETVTAIREKDGTWHVGGYFIK
jgi:hypothetical protein